MHFEFSSIIKTLLLWPFYLPHFVLFLINNDIISKDIEGFTPNTHKYLLFFLLISSNECFNELFFHRIKRYKIRKFLIQKNSSFTIPYDVVLGMSPKFDHPFSTIINAKRIGNNFRCKNNITIGNINDDDNFRPCIGDNVYIGANAVIIGNITIGNNVTIGAGTVVVKDIPDNCTVVGNPAKIIEKND